jgi:lysozyme
VTDETVSELVADLVRDEGTGPMIRGRLMPYTDSTGHLTIGFGRNLEDRGISLEEAEMLLRNDLKDVQREMAEAFPWAMFLDPVRQRVLANMLFNMGLPKLQGFHSTLRAMKAGDYTTAADQMRRSLWYGQTKRRAERLVQMMQTGVG